MRRFSPPIIEAYRKSALLAALRWLRRGSPDRVFERNARLVARLLLAAPRRGRYQPGEGHVASAVPQLSFCAVMSANARQFSRADLAELLDFVSANAASRAPKPAYLMSSDVAWRLPGSAPTENVRL